MLLTMVPLSVPVYDNIRFTIGYQDLTGHMIVPPNKFIVNVLSISYLLCY